MGSIFRKLLAIGAVFGTTAFGYGDCGKIPIPPCPNNVKPAEFLNKIAGQGNAAMNQGNPLSNSGEKPADIGDSGAGDGQVGIPPLTGEDGESAVQMIAGDGSRGFFTEPSQCAVIAWNGKEEILVLHTEEHSTVGTGAMLSFMPLPGRPIEIKKGDQQLYDKAYSLVKRKLETEGVPIAGGIRENQVVMERTIGAHNVFVWRIDNINDFADKVQSYVQKRFGGKAVALLTKSTEEVVKNYYDRKFRYFAFDLVNATNRPKSDKTAIEYHFESKFVYYPLVVSKSGGHDKTRVELVVFTDKQGVNANIGKLRFADDANKNGDIMTMGRKSATVTNQELRTLHPGMAALFNNQDVRARVWVLRGDIDRFEGDVQAYKQ